MVSLKRIRASSKSYGYLEPFIRRYLSFKDYFPWIRHHVSLIVLIVLGFLSILMLFKVIDPYPLRDWMHLKRTLEELGLIGPVVYVLLVAFLPLFSPISILIITGSASFGHVPGMILSYIGAQINANLTFMLVRTLSIEEKWGKGESTSRYKAAIQRNGFHLVLLLQTLSVFPFVAINSAAAASGIGWNDFARATLLGTILPIVIYSLIGEVLVPRLMPPQVYFAFVAFVMLMIVVAALKKRETYLRRKGMR